MRAYPQDYSIDKKAIFFSLAYPFELPPAGSYFKISMENYYNFETKNFFYDGYGEVGVDFDFFNFAIGSAIAPGLWRIYFFIEMKG